MYAPTGRAETGPWPRRQADRLRQAHKACRVDHLQTQVRDSGGRRAVLSAPDSGSRDPSAIHGAPPALECFCPQWRYRRAGSCPHVPSGCGFPKVRGHRLPRWEALSASRTGGFARHTRQGLRWEDRPARSTAAQLRGAHGECPRRMASLTVPSPWLGHVGRQELGGAGWRNISTLNYSRRLRTRGRVRPNVFPRWS